MMNARWMKQFPPYEGNEPYLFFAFAEQDSAKVWKQMHPLLARGCRIWYSSGPAGSAAEVLRRQERAGGAALTLVYLTDAACADKDTKSYVLVNQKFRRRILCLDPDGTDRRLAMGLRENTPEIPLYKMRNAEEAESAIIHADGFSFDMIGQPVHIKATPVTGRLTVLFCALAVVFGVLGYIGFRLRPVPADEVKISDPALLSAVREAADYYPLTEAALSRITCLRFEKLPESWEELSLLPALERIGIPQQALTGDAALPEGEYVIELIGGGA